MTTPGGVSAFWPCPGRLPVKRLRQPTGRGANHGARARGGGGGGKPTTAPAAAPSSAPSAAPAASAVAKPSPSAAVGAAPSTGGGRADDGRGGPGVQRDGHLQSQFFVQADSIASRAAQDRARRRGGHALAASDSAHVRRYCQVQEGGPGRSASAMSTSAIPGGSSARQRCRRRSRCRVTSQTIAT